MGATREIRRERASLSAVRSLVVVLTVMARYGTSSHKSIRIIVFFIFRKISPPRPLIFI